VEHRGYSRFAQIHVLEVYASSRHMYIFDT
jgi:hypothetical protein